MMKTPIHNRPIPHGYKLEWDPTLWNVGYLFSWSEVFGAYVLQSNQMGGGAVTVRPGETIGESLQREGFTDRDYTLFFAYSL